MNCLLLNFILKRSNSEPPNYRREQVTVLGKNQKNLNQDVKIKTRIFARKFELGLLPKN